MSKEFGTDKKIILGLILLSLVLFVVGLSVGYYWDSIKNPPGDENSVTAPSNY